MLREDVLSIEEFNLDAAAAMTLILVATGQTIVLIRGGIDLSVGGMVSLSTVLAATQFGNSAGTADTLVCPHPADRRRLPAH